MVDILEVQFPKGECKERGSAMVMLSYIEMMLQGKKFKNGEPVPVCRGCNKSTGILKYYIIADDLEKPKPYHASCMRNFKIEVIRKLSDMKSEINV